MEKEKCPQCEENKWTTVIGDFIWQCRTCGYIRETNIWLPKDRQWDREKGSKQEQGIETPPQPFRKECGCLHRNNQLYTPCQAHYFGWELAKKNQPKLYEEWSKPKEPEKESEKIEKIVEKKPASPWVENTKTGEEVQVGIITPENTNE